MQRHSRTLTPASPVHYYSALYTYCERKELTITARYQEVGRGWTKKRPEFQRMLADAKRGRFDTIVCWKSDRLSRGMYPAAALMEVVEAHQIRLEAVMDAIDMKTFGLMAAIGKIELDNFRERSTMGKRGTAKQGRVPTGRLPYGYRIGDDGRPEVIQEQAEVVRRIFHMYVHEGMGSPSIAVRLTDEGIPTQTGKSLWLQSRVHHVLGNATYTGTWIYGKYRHISTEDGMKIYDQPRDTWIEPGFPILAVFRFKGQPKRDGSIIVRYCKASQWPVYLTRDAFAVVEHPSCPSSSSSCPLPVG